MSCYHISMLPMRLGWLRRSSTFFENIRQSLLCCIWVFASTFSQLRWRTLRNTCRFISFSRFTSALSSFTPNNSIMWNRVFDSFREPANVFSRSLWCSVGKTGRSRQNTFIMNLGMFVAFRFFFSGFQIRRGKTRSNGLTSCLGSKTTFLVFFLVGDCPRCSSMRLIDTQTFMSGYSPCISDLTSICTHSNQFLQCQYFYRIVYGTAVDIHCQSQARTLSMTYGL